MDASKIISHSSRQLLEYPMEARRRKHMCLQEEATMTKLLLVLEQ